MRKLVIFSVFCLVGVCRAAPTSEEPDWRVEVSEEIYDKSFVKYKSEHDIVDILVPLNALNFGGSESESEAESLENIQDNVTIFFVETDVNDGKRVDRGLYVYKNSKAKKILPTGRTAAASKSDNKLVYFGASDGLYIYDVASGFAVKYGSITDGIISLDTDDTGKIIYILTDDHKMYKVTNNGETKEEIENVKDAKEIVLDNSNNLYYYNSKKEIFVRTEEGVKKFETLPPTPETITLIRPPFILNDGIAALYDNSIEVLYVNGTTEEFDLKFSPEAKPIALGPQAILLQYYGHNKQLYEYNILTLIASEIFNDVKERAEVLRNTATDSKNTLGTKKS